MSPTEFVPILTSVSTLIALLAFGMKMGKNAGRVDTTLQHHAKQLDDIVESQEKRFDGVVEEFRHVRGEVSQLREWWETRLERRDQREGGTTR